MAIGSAVGRREETEPEDSDCDRDCLIEEVLARPFVVQPANEVQVAEALEKALAPLDEYRLVWMRSR